MSSDTLCFFEQTDFSVRFARCSTRNRPLRIEELLEVSPSEISPLIAKLDPAASVICALRPKPVHLHLATSDEAKRHAGLAGVRTFARQPATTGAGTPAWFATLQAGDGAVPAATPWLLATTSTEAFSQSLAAFGTLTTKSRRSVSATFATVGALIATVTKPTLYLEIGELVSQAMLVGREGVIAAKSVALNLDGIAEAVQTELNLKFRGSAAKLFFNADYDFSDTSAKIAARLAAALKADLAPLSAGRAAPTSLFCAGLPATHTWFAPQLAAALGLSLHAPDVKAWSEAAAMSFASSELAAALSPAWLGLLHLVNNRSSAWQAEWQSLQAAPAAAPGVPAVAAPVVIAPAVITTAAPASTPAPVPATVPVPAPAPAKPAASTPAKPATPTPPTAPAKLVQSSVNYSSKATPEKPAQKSSQKKGPEPSVSKSSPAPAAKPAPAVAAPVASTGGAPANAPRKSKLPLMIGAGVAAVLVLLGGYYLHTQKEAAAQLLAEKQNTEQRLRAEEEKARLAQQKAQEEFESRKQLESVAAQKLAQSEAARQQAENETRVQVAARLANARGTLVITTDPAGASVKVGDLPPRPSPATFTDIRIGKYPVTISLARHGTANVELEVRENSTTESGLIKLERVFGTLEMKSGPGAVDYEVRPANALMLAPDARRTGRTPATLADLPPDDYVVTFSREGWNPHTETVTVTRGNTARLEWTFPNGTVSITSSPNGATVSHAGEKIGTTPLTVADQPPGDIRYELTLDGFDPVTLDGKIVGGANLALSARFPLEDRFFPAEAVDHKPEPVSSKLPELPYYLTLEKGRVEIELIVNRDGTARNLRLAHSSHPDFGKFCMTAVAKWKFKPGMKDGKPVNVRMTLPFVFAGPKS